PPRLLFSPDTVGVFGSVSPRGRCSSRPASFLTCGGPPHPRRSASLMPHAGKRRCLLGMAAGAAVAETVCSTVGFSAAPECCTMYIVKRYPVSVVRERLAEAPDEARPGPPPTIPPRPPR